MEREGKGGLSLKAGKKRGKNNEARNKKLNAGRKKYNKENQERGS